MEVPALLMLNSCQLHCLFLRDTFPPCHRSCASSSTHKPQFPIFYHVPCRPVPCSLPLSQSKPTLDAFQGVNEIPRLNRHPIPYRHSLLWVCLRIGGLVHLQCW